MKSKGSPIRTVSEHPDFIEVCRLGAPWTRRPRRGSARPWSPISRVVARGKDGFTEFAM